MLLEVGVHESNFFTGSKDGGIIGVECQGSTGVTGDIVNVKFEENGADFGTLGNSSMDGVDGRDGSRVFD